MRKTAFMFLIALTISFFTSVRAAPIIKNLEYSINPQGITIFVQIEEARSVQVEAGRTDRRMYFDLKGVSGPELSLAIANSNVVKAIRLDEISRRPPTTRLSLALLQPVDYKIERKDEYVKLDLLQARPPKVEAVKTAPPEKPPEVPSKPAISPPRERPARVKVENLISLDVQDVDLRDLLRALAKQAGINVILDDSIQGKVSVILKDITPSEAIKRVLASAGYSFKEGEGYIRPAPASETELIRLKHVDASAIKAILSPLVSSPEQIQADPNTNSLLLSGLPEEVERLRRMVGELDLPPQDRSLKLFTLSNASAKQVAQIVTGFLSPGGKAVADEATNSVAVLDTPETLQIIQDLVGRIDGMAPLTAKAPGREMVTEVFMLRYIDANSLLETIRDFLSPEGKAQAFYPQRSMITPLEREGGAGIRYVRAETAAGPTSRGEPEKRTKWSNTLIVTDTPDGIARIREVIRKLDVKPRQVLIEAKIVEISLDKTNELGIQWQAYHPDSKSLVKFSPSKVSLSSGVQLGTISTKLLDQIMGTIQVLETEGKAKVLATPRTTTLNNELAQIIVSDRIPITTVYAGERFTTTSYEYLDVGINLTVVPHISEDGYIILEVNPRIDSIKGTFTETAPPVISSRVAHTKVAVKDGETLVIGGLMKEEVSENSSRVPIIGSLPVIGWIFGSKEGVKRKTDLMVFITPKIISK